MTSGVETEQRRSSCEGSEVAKGPLTGIKIAWIEDDHGVISPLLNPLRDEGVNVKPYGSVEGALSGLDELRGSDLIILDLILPEREKDQNASRVSHASCLLGLTGQESRESVEERFPGVGFLRHLREKGIEVPVIVFTVVADRNIHKQIEELGVDSIIVKPELPGEFCDKVKEILETNERLKLRKELGVGILPDAAVGKLKRVVTEYARAQLNILREVDEDGVAGALYAAIILTQKCGEIRQFPSGAETSQRIQPEVAERTTKIWNTWLRSQGWTRGDRLPDNFINLLNAAELEGFIIEIEPVLLGAPDVDL